MERREAPGCCATTPFGRVSAGRAHTVIPCRQGSPFGVRAANDVGRCASRGCTAAALSAAAPCAVIKRRDRRRPR